MRPISATRLRPVMSPSRHGLRNLAGICLFVFIAGLVVTVHGLPKVGGAPRQAAASRPDAGAGADFERLVGLLTDDDYRQREVATRQLIAFGPSIAPAVRARMVSITDAEAIHRLAYVLDNIAPPPLGVLIVRSSPTCGLNPGDILVQAGGRKVTSQADLLNRLTGSAGGLFVRVIGPDGPRDLGPIGRYDIQCAQDYVAPRGETLARVLRLFVAGHAEQAYAALAELRDEIPTAEFSPALRAQIAFCAGHASDASRLMQGLEMMVRVTREARILTNRSLWSAPSEFDLAGPGKAPYQLELEMMNLGGPAVYDNEDDPDLRVQRVLVPAGRFVDALVRSAELWTGSLRNRLPEPGARSPRLLAGNTLAVASWMFHTLELRSESCRLIEPRSVILRRAPGGLRKWMRVDTDAWLPLLQGRTAEAVDGFFEDAMSILQAPPSPEEPSAVIRNPRVAARLGFFLYKDTNESRRQEALRAISPADHPAAAEYLHWMMRAADPGCADAIRVDLAAALAGLSDSESAEAALGLALLEYLREKPEAEIFAAARHKLFQSLAGAERASWLAVVDGMAHLAAGRLNDAVRVLDQIPESDRRAAPLRHTVAFLTNPPPAARNHPAALSARLAVPFGKSGRQWVILGHDRRAMLLDDERNTLTPVPGVPPGWFPGPLAWPWIAREESTGRVWAYSARRVYEIAPSGGLRLNISPAQIDEFDRTIGPRFALLADAVQSVPMPAGENGEFLRADIKAHADSVVDPDLPELVVINPLPQDPRMVFVGVRGGPHLLVDSTTQKTWTSEWFREKLELPTAPVFFAQAAWPERRADEPAPPVVFLISDQGLIRFDTTTETARRIAIPGETPYPALVPESVPYVRRDPAYLYVARLPSEGGRVYRLTLAGGAVQEVDLVNASLPASYYQLLYRSRIRAMVDERLPETGVGNTAGFLSDATQRVQEIPARQ